MTTGLDTTIRLLVTTPNEAAVPCLFAALDSSDSRIKLAAIRALVDRNSASGHRELVLRWHTFSEAQRQMITEHAGRLSGAIRDGMLSSDAVLNRNACDAVVRFREYEMIPTLVRAAEDKSNSQGEVAAQTVLLLVDALYQEFTAPRDYRQRRDPALTKQFVHGTLEASMREFDKHKRVALAEAYLLVAQPDEALLKQSLQDPHDRLYTALVGALNTSSRPGVLRLIADMLNELHAPPAILHVVARRRDVPFLRTLLARTSEDLTPPQKANLRKIEAFSWLKDEHTQLAALNDEELRGAVRLVAASGMGRLQVFEVIKFALLNGGVLSRRTAAAMLAEFKGGEANELVWHAIGDADPQTQAIAIGQLRDRGLPGVMQRLVELIDSPHEAVRDAVQQALVEFTFARFLTAFEAMTPDARISSGPLVKRIDPRAIELLKVELASPSRTRRIRGLEVARCMCAERDIEAVLFHLAEDSDHFIRTEAARGLAVLGTDEAYERLREMLLDRSVSVQEVAEQALEQFALSQNTDVGIPDPFSDIPDPFAEAPPATTESATLASVQEPVR